MIQSTVLKIGDFGISKFIEESTRAYTFKGGQHAFYMAPEGWQGHTNSFKLDVYSVGLVFFQIVTLRHPLLDNVKDPGNEMDWQNAHLFQQCPDVRSIRSEVSLSISQLLTRMVSKRPDQRPAWDEVLRNRQPNYRGLELKGKDLSPSHQTAFVNSVVVSTRGLSLTFAGTKTTLFKREIAQQVVKDSATVLRAAADHRANVADFFRRMARWMETRSPENLMWIHCLGDVIHLSLQHAIVMFAEEAHDSEFEDIEILIDRSFIAKSTHIEFWQEWLRNFLYSKSKKEPMATIKEWRERDHPFNRKYGRARGMTDWTDLYRNHVHFVNSHEVPGVQIADICANICYRYYSEKHKYRPYRLLRSRIMGKHNAEMHYAIFNESSLLTDAPENHVTDYSPEETAALAEIKASREQR